jgi:hypothetical protein
MVWSITLIQDHYKLKQLLNNMRDYKVTLQVKFGNDLPIGLSRVFNATNAQNALKQAMKYWILTYKQLSDDSVLEAQIERLN